ncbi:MAG: nucleoside triphosphate pyrophosphohydrolase [Leptospira sp.]|nr:nucleoside triphosphate pyrophosphohydrolase [Leptospira sp.]
MNEIERLREITAILRSEQGCEWDKKQTHKSMIQCLIEEVYEVVEALETEDMESLKEELGDLLFQIAFHCQLAEEKQIFTLDDVAKSISDKLVRRHPHVFKSADTLTADEVVINWEKIKQEEKAGKSLQTGSLLDSVPKAHPALLKAEKLQKEAKKTGFDWDKIEDIEKKLNEEIAEFYTELNEYKANRSNFRKMEEEFGDVLFTMVNLSRTLNISAESALNSANLKFKTRFDKLEKIALESGKELNGMNLKEMDELWEIVKKTEKSSI